MAVHPSTPRDPGSGDLGISDVLNLVRDCTAALSSVRQEVGAATEAQLLDLVSELGELALWSDAAEVAVVGDALTRGLPAASQVPLSPADWIATASRRHTRGSASRVVKIAEALRSPTITRPAGALAPGQDGEVLGEAILGAVVPLPCGQVAMDEMRRLAPDLQPAFVPAAWEAYALVGAGGDPREVRRIRPELYARFGRPDRLNDRDEGARKHAFLSTGAVDPVDGLTDYRMSLSAESAAILEAALDRLTKPQPGPDGGADPRSYPTRRADALIELVRRATTHGVVPTVAPDTGAGLQGDGPGHPAADRPAADRPAAGRPASQVSLIVRLSDLRDEDGCATTITGLDAGRYLSIATARLLSCNTMLAPIIVDEHGTPIIIGHSKRLFTSQQVRAMQLRDDGCSFLHCTRPAGWADAHHLIHWADGGATEIDNGALLCNYHHHVVHSRRLAGWVTTDPPDDTLGRPPGSSETSDAEDLARRRDRGEPAAADRPVGPTRVHWDLTPGSYDRLLAARVGGSAA